MNVVPVMRLSPSGPDLSLLAPTQVGPVLQPANPPIICFRNVFVATSMTSTDLLFRSVKYMRPLAPSTALMSKEKFVPAPTPGTGMIFSKPGVELVPPPPQPPSITLARSAKPRAKYLVISSSFFSSLALRGRTGNTHGTRCRLRVGTHNRTRRGCQFPE